ncbi:MAG: hypothetical protein R3F14_21130 [Polyangiaceae bacterium]
MGIAAQATFAFVRLPRERGRLFLGPRLSAEAVIDTRGNTAATEGVELYHLWLVVRWVTFDDSIGR